jgi:hypothetical protein
VKVAFDVFVEPDLEPRPATEPEHTLGLHLRHGFVEMGPRRSAFSRVRFAPGEIRLSIRHREQWFGAVDLDLVRISISAASEASKSSWTRGSTTI